VHGSVSAGALGVTRVPMFHMVRGGELVAQFSASLSPGKLALLRAELAAHRPPGLPPLPECAAAAATVSGASAAAAAAAAAVGGTVAAEEDGGGAAAANNAVQWRTHSAHFHGSGADCSSSPSEAATTAAGAVVHEPAELVALVDGR
jgi:hypothetical protein